MTGNKESTTIGTVLDYSTGTIGFGTTGDKRITLLRIIKMINKREYTLREILQRLVPDREYTALQPHQYDLFFDWRHNKVYMWEELSGQPSWNEYDIREIIRMMKQTGELK